MKDSTLKRIADGLIGASIALTAVWICLPNETPKVSEVNNIEIHYDMEEKKATEDMTSQKAQNQHAKDSKRITEIINNNK